MDPYVQTLADLCRHFALFFRGGADEAWYKAWPQVAGVLLAPADAREPVAIAELDPNAVAQSEAKLFYGVSRSPRAPGRTPRSFTARRRPSRPAPPIEKKASRLRTT